MGVGQAFFRRFQKFEKIKKNEEGEQHPVDCFAHLQKKITDGRVNRGARCWGAGEYRERGGWEGRREDVVDVASRVCLRAALRPFR